MQLETCPCTDEQLYSAFCILLCLWRPGEICGWWDKICKVMTILYCSVWWELETHGHLEKLFSENELWWQIMWWTPGTEINYSPKELGHSLFLMEPGPHLGLEIVVMYVPQAGNSSILCYKMNSWAEGKVWVTDHPKSERICLLASASLFIIYYRRPLKINPFINTLSHMKLHLRLGYKFGSPSLKFIKPVRHKNFSQE